MSNRYPTGQKIAPELKHKGCENILAALDDISPDLAKYAFEFPHGDLSARPGLDLQTREIANISALIALNKTAQLKFHINAALNAGCSETEIKETIIQMAVYAGFPAALCAMQTAKDVFEERKKHNN